MRPSEAGRSRGGRPPAGRAQPRRGGPPPWGGSHRETPVNIANPFGGPGKGRRSRRTQGSTGGPAGSTAGGPVPTNWRADHKSVYTAQGDHERSGNTGGGGTIHVSPAASPSAANRSGPGASHWRSCRGVPRRAAGGRHRVGAQSRSGSRPTTSTRTNDGGTICPATRPAGSPARLYSPRFLRTRRATGRRLPHLR